MYCFVAEFKHGPIQVDSFAAYVKSMHTDGDYRFNQEFEVKSIIIMFIIIIFMFMFVYCNFRNITVISYQINSEVLIDEQGDYFLKKTFVLCR